MMREIKFKGTEVNRVLYTTNGNANSLVRALGARGYRAELTSGEVDPWRGMEDRQSMLAVTGTLGGSDIRTVLFMVDDEGTMDAAWEAIHLYYPDATSDPMQKIDRPA